MPDEAVLDSSVEGLEETGVESAEIQVETPETPGISSETGKTPITEIPALQGGKYSPEVKGLLEKLKTDNPTLERQIRHALHAQSEWNKALPGGLKELNAMRDLVEQRGGPEGLQNLSQELDSFHDFDRMYTAGDPKALDFMTSEPEGQAAFLKLMPLALQKFESMDKGGYTGYMAGVFMSTMDAYRIPLVLERLQDFIGENPQAAAQLQKLNQFYKQMVDYSQSKSEFKPPEAAPDNRGSELDQREARLTREEWRRETAMTQQQTFSGEWARLAAGRKLTDTQDAAIRELFESRISKAVAARHSEKLERYFQAKDKNGFIRYANEITRTEVPTALKAAFEAVMPGKPGPRVGTPPAPKAAAPLAGGKNFVQVAKAPAVADINLSHPFNNAHNWQKGLVVLKDGRKVQFKR